MSVFSARARLDTEVRTLLQERIKSDVYPVGEALPSEVNLAAELGVSRVTLRQVLQSLEEEGVLVKKHGVGTFVSEPPPVLECVLHENLGVTEMIERSGLTPGTVERSVLDPYRAPDVAALLGQFDVQIIEHPMVEDLVGLSDQRSYWEFDIPALMINDTAFIRNLNYHTTRDDTTTLSFDHMREVVTSTYTAVVGF